MSCQISELTKIFKKHKITGLSSDSRKIKKNDAFFAIKGLQFDGNDYIESALKSCAIAFTDRDDYHYSNRIFYVEDIRSTLIEAVEIIYPKIPDFLIAVTGTNGKSSVVSYVNQILSILGFRSATIGTLGVQIGMDFKKNSSLTMPDIIELRRTIHELVSQNINYISLEASSHGIHQERLGKLKFDSIAFSNFSQDHLDYHGSMEKYLKTKLKIFPNNMKKGGNAVINSDVIDLTKDYLNLHNINYSTIGYHGDLRIDSVKQTLAGQSVKYIFNGREYSFKTGIHGSFQAENILTALNILVNLGIDHPDIKRLLHRLKSVPGRLEEVTDSKSKFHIFIDYAHTSDALLKSLTELKEIKEKDGLLYVIFGCGGDRDISKRPIMGKIALEIADQVIITDDNPRNEDPAFIRSQIIIDDSMKEIASREKAISHTIARLKKNDILLIAGKGHESNQIIGDKILELSDIEIVKNIING